VIGISVKNGQLPIVQEFFELFKTPWEIYESGRVYDVVITTRTDDPLPDALLVIVFSPFATRIDEIFATEVGPPHRGGSVEHRNNRVPIYGDLLTFAPADGRAACVYGSKGVAGMSIRRGHTTILRIGYDLFEECILLLSTGQPPEHAETPTLDLHIDMVRLWIQQAGISFVEVPPAPYGHPFAVCLTHDIDFVGIRDHKFDHSMFGFLVRATFGSVAKVVRGRLSLSKLLGAWRAAAALPFVFLGWAEDFWEPFEWYLTVEKGLGGTYFLIPFKGHAGSGHSGVRASRRAAAYDVTEIQDAVKRLVDAGCEIGVHGIDAWHSAEAGRAERARVVDTSGVAQVGIRMHWLLRDRNTPGVLDDAGYVYDSTGGYNETIGYLNGTAQVFRPIGSVTILELPLHIQDGALFFPERLDLSEREAWTRCSAMVAKARALGGVLTVLWHDRSHGPERFWGDFYVRLVRELRSSGAWFATGRQLTGWFAARRAIRFERTGTGREAPVRIRYEGPSVHREFILRTYSAADGSTVVDASWSGATPVVVAAPHRTPAPPPDSHVPFPRAASGY
jgi:hypothetical protein